MPPGPGIEDVILPALNVIITDTVTPSCSNKATCIQRCRDIQTSDFNIGLLDIAYNFLVGSDGLIYEGRGWNKVSTIGANPYFRTSLQIAFIGAFDMIRPPKASLEALEVLLEAGIQNGKLNENYRLYAKRQVVPSSYRPGNELYEELKKSTHWVNA